ncbi:MAG: DUF6457 domain-containing protein [Actinomycetota bacterium]
MSNWIEDLAAAFALEPLSDAETDRLLLISRDVAHRVERKDTPLAAFLLAMNVAARIAEGSPRDTAIDEAIAAVRAMLPPASEPSRSPT